MKIQTSIPRYAAAIALVTTIAACGSSSPSARPAAHGSSSPAGGGASPVTTKALPAPCTLLTTVEVEPLFGTTAVDSNASTSGAPGVSQCAFTLHSGVQAWDVIVYTRDDYADDPSYIYPDQGTTSVPGLGYPAVVQTNGSVARITVQLGKNALQIDADFYTHPVDTTFVIQLAKDALGHV
jgi:hypothetical protein